MSFEPLKGLGSIPANLQIGVLPLATERVQLRQHLHAQPLPARPSADLEELPSSARGKLPSLLPCPLPLQPWVLYPSSDISAGLFYLGTFCPEKKLSPDKLIPHAHQEDLIIMQVERSPKWFKGGLQHRP